MHVRFGPLELDEERFLLLREGRRLRIRPKVFDLLVYLVRYRDRLVSRDELVLALWGTTVVGTGSLSGLVNELRRILGESGRGPSSIRTVHARGYQFVAVVEICEGASDEAPDQSGRPVTESSTSNREPMAATDPHPLVGPVRATLARVLAEGARALLIEDVSARERAVVIERSCATVAQAGFDVHRMRVGTGDSARSAYWGDRVLGTLIEARGVDAIRRAASGRARSIVDRSIRRNGTDVERPRDPLAARQHEERVWRATADIVRTLSLARPMAFVVEEVARAGEIETSSLRALLPMLESARVFVLAMFVGSAKGDDGTGDAATCARIERISLARRTRSRARRPVEERLEEHGLGWLPAFVVDVLLDQARHGPVDFEALATWLDEERRATALGTETVPTAPVRVRSMRTVRPDTHLRHASTGSR